MFVVDLLVYVFFAWAMCTLAQRSASLAPDSGTRFDRHLWAYVLFFTVIVAIRWRVGADSTAYIKIFQQGVVREGSEEYLWDALVTFVHGCGLHFVVGTGVMAFLQIALLTKGALSHRREVLVWLPVVLFGSRYFLDLMNGVRQMTAACGFVFLMKYAQARRPAPYVVGVLLLAGLHHSVLLLLPAYLLTYVPWGRLRLPDRRWACLAALITCFVMGQTPSFQGLLKYIEPIVATAGYEGLTDFYADTLSGEHSEALAFGPTMLSFLLSSVAVIWYGPQLRARYEGCIPMFNLWYFGAVFYSCTYFLVCNMSHMMIRPFQYFELFLAFMLALLLHLLREGGGRTQVQLYALIVILWVCTAGGVYQASGKQVETVIYKTFFGHV